MLFLQQKRRSIPSREAGTANTEPSVVIERRIHRTLRLNGPSTNAERPTLDESRSSLCPLHPALPSPHPRPGGSGGEHGD